MAGAGRRSQYRKHLTDSVLNDFPEPKVGESSIAQVAATRGSNQFDILLSNKKQHLSILPTKFHKCVWLKRNDYVIVEGTEDDEVGVEEENAKATGIRFIIKHILYKEQIKHLKAKGLWPKEFAEDDKEEEDEEATQEENDEDTDGIVYDQGYDLGDDDLIANTNRIARLQLADDSEDDSD